MICGPRCGGGGGVVGGGPELRITGAAAQTRMVSVARIRLASRKSTRLFKGIICDDISEFESHMPSQAVGLYGVIFRRAHCSGSWFETRPSCAIRCYRASFSATNFSSSKIVMEVANILSASYAMTSKGLCRYRKRSKPFAYD